VVAKVRALLYNRNFILLAAITAGLLFDHAAQWTRVLVLPTLALILTLAMTDFSGKVYEYRRSPLIPALVGVFMNYVILGNFIVGSSAFLIHDEKLWIGFIIMAAVPPAVAVAPLASSWGANEIYAVVGAIGAYIGALIIIPVIASALLDIQPIDITKLFVVATVLILLPLLLYKIIVRRRLHGKIEPIKGILIKWCYFLILYTIVGLNRETIIGQPSSLFPVAAIALSSTFVLGFLIEWIGTLLRISKEKLTSLCLLGTLKNYGLAAGLALSLFSKETALPAAVFMIIMMIYIAWLDFKMRWA
jgi:bile acid:Na+ symporter, BASS family